ncbi:MAG: hypothetical protein J6T28_05585 [Paludibacteraceae bacterium]|nr:hypothetical protein [Paludibacteraceae bacterium]MBP5480955.1 hypothetical protein [Paludibacteraceae bacterium]
MQNLLNIPKYILWALVALTIIFTLLFFCGSTEMYTCNGIQIEAPSFVPTFLGLAYAFIILATLATLAFALKSFVSKLMTDPKSVMVPLIFVGVLCVLLLVTYFGADTTKMTITGYEGSQEPWVYRITNMCMMSSFILAAIAFIATIGSSLFKKL